jgi:perosamine synthetase
MKKILLGPPSLDQKDINAVVKVLKSRQLSLGEQTEKFEAELAQFVGARYAAAVASGTAALHLAVIASGIQAGDEVITSPFSFVASTNCFLYEKARPQFVDIDPASFNLDPNKIEAAITPKTKAIIGVDIFGYPAEWATIIKIARRHHLKIIEDAAEALGAKYQGKRLGSLGHPTVFAFYPNKQMTTAEGGALVTNNQKLHQLVKGLSNQGRGPDMNWLRHLYLGYNYRLTEIQAALGRSQLAKLPAFLAQRDRVAGWYRQRLQKVNGLTLLKANDRQHQRSWFVYVVRLDKFFNRDRVMKRLLSAGIPTKAYLPSIHLQPYMQSFGFKPGDFPVAEAVSASTLALPFSTAISESTVDYVCQKLIKILKSKP